MLMIWSCPKVLFEIVVVSDCEARGTVIGQKGIMGQLTDTNGVEGGRRV